MEVPVLFDSKTECCGCTACEQACPNGAISMQPDKEGFLYPIISADRCVGCNMCKAVCPMHYG